MIFETWLQKQKNRDDIIGDLAKDFILANKRQGGQRCNKAYLKSMRACQGAYDALEQAQAEYGEKALSLT